MTAAGAAAAELLLQALASGDRNGPPPADIILPTEFIARPSCARVG